MPAAASRPAAGRGGGRRDFAGLAARRMRAAEMFGRGKRQVDVVTELGVSAQTASRWHRAWQEQGQAGLAGAGRAGRRCRLADEQLAAVEAALVAGPAANGFPTEMWTLARVADDRGADRGAVFADPDLGDSAAAAGLDPPAPGAPGGGA